MLDLIKDYVRINNLSLAESQSSVYEFDCIIPDVMPDMLKILAVDTYAETSSVDKTSDGANILFKINYKILYLSDSDKQIRHFLLFLNILPKSNSPPFPKMIHCMYFAVWRRQIPYT